MRAEYRAVHKLRCGGDARRPTNRRLRWTVVARRDRGDEATQWLVGRQPE
jgi:hypothetical protein